MLSAHDAAVVRRDVDLPGLAVLLDPRAFLEVLSREFPLVRVTTAEILYLRYKPGTSCLCSYRVSGPEGSSFVYGKAFPPRRGEKLRHWRGGVEPKRSATRRASDRWHIGISRFPDDRRLKALPRLLERGDLTTLRYKPERRWVASLAEDGVPSAVLKVYDSIGYRSAHARAGIFGSGEVLLVPAWTAHSDRSRLLGFEWIEGRGLPDELTGSDATRAAETAGVALAELHDADVPASLSKDMSAHAVHAAARGVAAVLPEIAALARSLGDEIASRLESCSVPLRPAHGDFHAEQVIVKGNRAAILDFDRACLASPAADLGTFAAHLYQGVLRGVYAADAADAGMQALVEGYTRRRPASAPEQIRLHTAAALLRLAPEPFRRHEPRWPELTEALLDRAARALGAERKQAAGHTASGSSKPPVVVDASRLGDDPAWSFLRPALDPEKVRAELDAVLSRVGAPDATLREIRVSRHKAGRRCVVEYTFAGEGEAEPLVILGKSRMKGLNANARFALESLWSAGFAPAHSRVCVPQPLGAVPAWRMTLQRKAAGDPAGERLAQPDGAGIATRIAEAIYTLHTRGIAPIRRHTIEDELQILRERLRQMSEYASCGRIEGLVKGCEQLASELPRYRPQPIHRDFYPAHVLVDGNRLWLIDLDLYCAGDAALDVGNFLAHMIEERVRRDGGADGLTETESALETRYVQLAGDHVLPAVRAYTTLSLVRHVHLSTQFPDRQHTTGALLALCERRLSDRLESKLYA